MEDESIAVAPLSQDREHSVKSYHKDSEDNEDDEDVRPPRRRKRRDTTEQEGWPTTGQEGGRSHETGPGTWRGSGE
ncbi:hypothetical protein GMDG_08769 [Pseudogymnoascus destructans 20631-21]|uniref:Uncharacterized protein n=1 Tax=Pseudogymnoascus destructans (strain ATCC MYA-4855 / 20631-21) TaxID=658429 RepID=L8FLU5_PSED2|nr:hypothetical protein GMDG_08769 [Pseudogymnoascus destructans 20631-21]